MVLILIALLLSSGQPRLVGIMGAMDVEVALIREEMKVEQVDTISRRIFTIGKLNNIPCVCVKAGIGKVNAALTAEILIREYGVDAIIFTGVAGGINPQLNIGDIVIAERVLHHDYGQITPATFMPWDTVGFVADSFLVAITAQAADNVLFDSIPQKIRKKDTNFPRITIGRVTTGDQFIASEEKREWIEKTFRADCVEMEGAAVAQVCVINNVPFVIIRSLSDLANEKAEIDFEAFVRYAAKNSSLIVREITRLLSQ